MENIKALYTDYRDVIDAVGVEEIEAHFNFFFKGNRRFHYKS